MKKSIVLSILMLFIGTSFIQAQNSSSLVDDVVSKTIVLSRKTLKPTTPREGDLHWQKRVWQVIDTHEKQNKTFSYPKEPFVSILLEAAAAGQITAYSTLDDEFTSPYDTSDVSEILYNKEVLTIWDDVNYIETYDTVHNYLNPEDITRFRIKEDWYFDSQSSTMKVKILGIAPLMDVYDDDNNFLYEQPLFWVYMPEASDVLDSKTAFNSYNDASRISWKDLFDMRKFSSTIYKTSNVYDRRLKDAHSGLDILVEAEKEKQKLLNRELDMWSY